MPPSEERRRQHSTSDGDPLNLAMMAVPMIVFYEIGIVLARILGKRKAEPVGAAAAKA